LIVNSGGPAGDRDYYSGGLCYFGIDTDAVYLSQDDGGTHEIYEATTTDGSDWSLSQVTDGSNHHQWRPIRVRNADPELPPVGLRQRFSDSFTKYQQDVISGLDDVTAQPETPISPATNPYQGAWTEVDGERIRLRSFTKQS